MPRLIDADALPKFTGYVFSACEVAKAVENAPTVDAVEVVRCKDCKWYKESKYSELSSIRFCYRLRNDDVPVGYNWDENDFCSYGERREDAD